MRKTIYLLIITCQLVLTNDLLAQGASINTDGSSPHASAILELKSTAKGFLLPRMSQAQRMAINNPANGLIVYDTTNRKFFYWDSPAWKNILNNDSWIRSLSHNWLYNYTDSVGLGIGSPLEKMHIFNGNLLLSRTSTSTNTLLFNTSLPGGIYTETQGISFNISNVSKAGIKYVYTNDAFGINHLRFSASTATAYDMVITGQGKVGIGTSVPSEMLTINSTDPMIQLNNGSVEKGYIQLNGDDLRIGTNASNSLGKVVFRNDGDDRVKIYGGSTYSYLDLYTAGSRKGYIYTESNGNIQIQTIGTNSLLQLNDLVYINGTQNRVGIGTSTPTQELSVNGDMDVTEDIVVGGEIRKTITGGVNLIPTAYGCFDGDGVQIDGSSNISAALMFDSYGRPYYKITTTGHSLVNSIVVANGYGITGGGGCIGHFVPAWQNSEMRLYHFNCDDDVTTNAFMVVIYN